MEMESKWEYLDVNELIKQRFKGFKDGLVAYHDKVDWILPAKTAQMIKKYQVRTTLNSKLNIFISHCHFSEYGGEAR